MAINWERGFRKGRMRIIVLWQFVALGIGLLWGWYHRSHYFVMDGGKYLSKDGKTFSCVSSGWSGKREISERGREWNWEPVLIGFLGAAILGIIVVLLMPRIVRYFGSVKSGFVEEEEPQSD